MFTVTAYSWGISPDSFHVFSHNGEYIFYDRASSVVCELNEFAYDLFALIEERASQNTVLDVLTAKYGDFNIDECTNIISELCTKGFFSPLNPWPNEESIDFGDYLAHRPRRIQLMMAESCNLKCGYCYAWRNKANDHRTYMSWHTAKAAVDFFVWRSGRRRDLQITFFGGEPLLNYNVIRKIVQYCREIESLGHKTFYFELITNGTLLEPEITDYLIEHNFLLFISLDGWNEMHNHNRPAIDGSDLHDTILKNAIYANNKYNEAGLPKVKIRANLTSKYMDIAKVAAYLESFGFTYIGIGAIEPMNHDAPCEMALSEDQMDELSLMSSQMIYDSIEKIKHGKKNGAYVERSIRKAVYRMEHRTMPGIICGVCRNTAIVDNKGYIYPCHRYAGMPAYQMGDIFFGLDQNKIKNYYQKIATRAIRDCPQCWVKEFCSGGCPWSLSDNGGNIVKPSEQSCERMRKGIERGLWIRKQLGIICPEWFDEEHQQFMEQWDWANNRIDDTSMQI